MEDIEWYDWLWMWVYPTKSVVDKDTKHGMELTTTLYYKEIGDKLYLVSTHYKTRELRSKSARRARRHK